MIELTEVQYSRPDSPDKGKCYVDPHAVTNIVCGGLGTSLVYCGANNLTAVREGPARVRRLVDEATKASHAHRQTMMRWRNR
jgi:hypothetical protein